MGTNYYICFLGQKFHIGKSSMNNPFIIALSGLLCLEIKLLDPKTDIEKIANIDEIKEKYSGKLSLLFDLEKKKNESTLLTICYILSKAVELNAIIVTEEDKKIKLSEMIGLFWKYSFMYGIMINKDWDFT
jgi:hypothetical protein